MSVSDFAVPFGFGRYLSVNGHYGSARITACLTGFASEFWALWVIIHRVPQNPAQTWWMVGALVVVGFVLFAWLGAIDSEERTACRARAAECWFRRRNTGVQRAEMDDPPPDFIAVYCFEAENARRMEAGEFPDPIMAKTAISLAGLTESSR